MNQLDLADNNLGYTRARGRGTRGPGQKHLSPDARIVHAGLPTKGTYPTLAAFRGLESIRCDYPGSSRSKSIQGRAVPFFWGLLSCFRRPFSQPIRAASQGRSESVAIAQVSGESSRGKSSQVVVSRGKSWDFHFFDSFA